MEHTLGKPSSGTPLCYPPWLKTPLGKQHLGTHSGASSLRTPFGRPPLGGFPSGITLGEPPWGNPIVDPSYGTPLRKHPLGIPFGGLPFWNTFIRTHFADHRWGNLLGGPTLGDSLWTHLWNPLEDPPWGTLFGRPPLGNPIWWTSVRGTPCGHPLREPFGEPPRGNHLVGPPGGPQFGAPLGGPPLCDPLLDPPCGTNLVVHPLVDPLWRPSLCDPPWFTHLCAPPWFTHLGTPFGDPHWGIPLGVLLCLTHLQRSPPLGDPYLGNLPWGTPPPEEPPLGHLRWESALERLCCGTPLGKRLWGASCGTYLGRRQLWRQPVSCRYLNSGPLGHGIRCFGNHFRIVWETRQCDT
jgi:hypothetical protein